MDKRWKFCFHDLVYGCLLVLVGSFCSACALPDPPNVELPTQPVILDITPAPTLDIDATATAYANLLRPTSTPIGFYVVREGDNLTELAARFDTTVEDIQATNNLTDANELVVGQELIIPSLLASPEAEIPPAEGAPPSEGSPDQSPSAEVPPTEGEVHQTPDDQDASLSDGEPTALPEGTDTPREE